MWLMTARRHRTQAAEHQKKQKNSRHIKRERIVGYLVGQVGLLLFLLLIGHHGVAARPAFWLVYNYRVAQKSKLLYCDRYSLTAEINSLLF